MNTYFNYQAQLRSLDLSRAISIPKGMGPFAGFASGEFKENSGATSANQKTYNIILYPDNRNSEKSTGVEGGLPNYSFLKPLMRDVQKHHGLLTNEQVALSLDASQTQDTSNEEVTFGLVTRDGFICINNQPYWSVPISGYSGSTSPKEVAVFARHNYIAEAVDNPVTLEAYAINYGISTLDTNAGSNSDYSDISSFYELYRKSMDIYYNRTDSPNFGKHNPLSSANELHLKLSYYDLLEYVKSKVLDFEAEGLTLIGIYGNGNNENGDLESFSIVPYEGKWPYDLPFNTAVMSGITKELNVLRENQEGFPYEGFNIKQYIDDQIKQLSSQLSNEAPVIPSGLICLWGQDGVPDGWEEYTDAEGKLVIGFMSGKTYRLGTGKDVITQVGKGNGATDSDWNITLNASDLPKHSHVLAVGESNIQNSGAEPDPFVVTWGRYSNNLSSTSLNGDMGKAMGISNGAVLSGPNLTNSNPSSYVSSYEQSQDSVSFSLGKILPIIALKYIIKK